MKILRAYIDEPKPESCEACDANWFDCLYNNFKCGLGCADYSDCPLIYAPSRSMQRRLDIQMPLEEK